MTNDSGFITTSDLPTKTSDLTNDGSDGTDTYVESGDLATVATSGDYTDLINRPTIPAAQVNSDWSANSGVAQILNKPTTISGYGITDAYTKTQVDALVASAYKFSGTVSTVAGMGALTAANVGNVYNFDTAFTTTSDFVEGAGVTYPAGTNVAIAEVSSGTYKYDVLSGFVDISGKEDTSNKVTSISSASTNTQYPSAAAVYTELSNIPIRKGTGTNSAVVNDLAHNVATGEAAISAGRSCTVNGDDSMAIGLNNIIGNDRGFAAGRGLLNGNADGTANTSCQATFGQFNVASGSFTRITGNGTADNDRSNCETLSPEGELWVATDVMCGGINQWAPAHKLSEKIDEAPTDGRKYIRQSSLWQAADGLLEYKGVVASAGDLPGNPLKISYGSGDSAVEFWAVFQFNNSTGKCTGMTLSVHPAGNNTSAWFRNNENILRNNASVLSLNSTLLEYETDFTTNPTTSGPWGQGVTSIQYSFNVDVYENDILTFSCNTWATENAGNGYKISDTNYTVTKPDAQTGELYFVQDEMEVYMYDGTQWFSFAPNDIYQLDSNHNSLVNGYHSYFYTDTTASLTVSIPDTLANGKYEIDCPTYYVSAGGVYTPGVSFTSTTKTITTVVGSQVGQNQIYGYHINVFVKDNDVYLYYNRS